MERPRWNLRVEGLGKIREAEVAIHPLMLFVGENNSGKSYLTSLLWGLFAARSAPFIANSPGSWAACEEWLRKRFGERAADPVSTYTLTPDDRDLFLRTFNTALEAQKTTFVRDVFNNASADLSRVSIPGLVGAAPVTIRWETLDGPRWPISHGPGVINIAVHPSTPPDRLPSGIIIQLLCNMLLFGPQESIEDSLDGAYRDGDPIFLPASRTGFMLLYKTAVSRSMTQQLRRTERAERTRTELTTPAIHFLDLLAVGLKGDRGQCADEADMLESALLGRVERVAGAGMNDFQYHPRGGRAPLTMAMSSSLVTELAPVILALRHVPDFPVLILEEPEAHLHPTIQRKLAQVIVRLVRKGLYVWITTHSENFCQQINNFLKIGAAHDREKLREEMGKKLGHTYGEQDYLTPADVAGYEFVNEGDHSVVMPLKKYEDGLVMPTFNKGMVELSKEVLFLDDQIGEKE